MKLKGLTKLALSGVALAAVAATLGTSTYAWYVSNSTATVSNISGQSKAQAAGSLLLNTLTKGGNDIIGVEDGWTNELDFANLTVKSASDFRLDPVTKDPANFVPAGDNKTTADATGWHDVAKNAIAPTSAFGYVIFGAQQTDTTKTKINVTFGISNDTAAGDKRTQTAYYAATGTTPSTLGDANEATGKKTQAVGVKGTFTEDFIFALKFDLYTVALGNNMSVTDALANTTARDTYAADTFKNLTFDANYLVKDGYYEDGDAHLYYKALSNDNVTNSTIDGGQSVTEGALSNGATSFNITANTQTLVVIRYWLDGADAQCFDSCINQKFKLNLKLEAVAPSGN